jgi:hypothetical protein
VTAVSVESAVPASSGVAPPLLRMVRETPTDDWNDSCAIAALPDPDVRSARGGSR